MSKFETLNKGEWSEVYALLKSLIDWKIKGCDYKLNILENKKWFINAINHLSNDNNIINFTKIDENIIKASNKNNSETFSIKEIEELSKIVFDKICSEKNKTFAIPEVQEFLKKAFNLKIKQNSLSKSDLKFNVIDKIETERGFSVKSNLASSPSLLNASQKTNFQFICNNYINNNLKKPKDIVNSIGVQNLIFDKMDSLTYYNNLQLIDTRLPEMLAILILYYYGKKASNIHDLIECIKKENPLNLSNVNVYEIKIGDFLMATAFGMIPKQNWDQKYTADGGLIVVKKNSDLATFYIIDQDLKIELRKYFIANSFLDTASTKRHKFGNIFKDENDNNRTKIKLNLLIRIN